MLEQWPELVRVLEAQLEVVTTERERIDILMQLAHIHEEHFLKADIAAQRLEQVLEIDPNHEEAYFALERCYRKLRQWPELINVYERHISATLDRRPRSISTERSLRSTPTRSRTPTARSTPTGTSSTSTT